MAGNDAGAGDLPAQAEEFLAVGFQLSRQKHSPPILAGIYESIGDEKRVKDGLAKKLAKKGDKLGVSFVTVLCHRLWHEFPQSVFRRAGGSFL